MCVTIGYSVPMLSAAGNKNVDWTFKGRNITGITCAINAQDKPYFSSVFYPATLVIIIANIIATIMSSPHFCCQLRKVLAQSSLWLHRSKSGLLPFSKSRSFENHVVCIFSNIFECQREVDNVPIKQTRRKLEKV
jgi:hypothetical protein